MEKSPMRFLCCGCVNVDAEMPQEPEEEESGRLSSTDGKWREMFGQEQRPPVYNAEDYVSGLKKYSQKSSAKLYTVADTTGGGKDGRNKRTEKDYRNPNLTNTNGEMTLRQFGSVSELLKKLKLDLKMSFLSFVREFVCEPYDGVTLMLDVLKVIQLSQTDYSGSGSVRNKEHHRMYKRALTDEFEALMCLKYALRCDEAALKLVDYPYGLYTIAVCIMSNFSKSRILALELLTKACGTPPHGHRKVAEAISTLRLRFGEPVRFKFLIGMLNSYGSLAFQLACLRFLNKLVETAFDTKERVYLQGEIEQAGFEPSIMRRFLTQQNGNYDVIREELSRWADNYIDINKIMEKRVDSERENNSLRGELNMLREKLNKLDYDKSLHDNFEQTLKDRCRKFEDQLNDLKNQLDTAVREKDRLKSLLQEKEEMLRNMAKTEATTRKAEEQKFTNRIVEEQLAASRKGEEKKRKVPNSTSTYTKETSTSSGRKFIEKLASKIENTKKFGDTVLMKDSKQNNLNIKTTKDKLDKDKLQVKDNSVIVSINSTDRSSVVSIPSKGEDETYTEKLAAAEESITVQNDTIMVNVTDDLPPINRIQENSENKKYNSLERNIPDSDEETTIDDVMEDFRNIINQAETLVRSSEPLGKKIELFEDRASPDGQISHELEIVPTRLPQPPTRDVGGKSLSRSLSDDQDEPEEGVFLDYETPPETSDTDSGNGPPSERTIESESTKSFGFMRPPSSVKRHDTFVEARRQDTPTGSVKRSESFQQGRSSSCDVPYDARPASRGEPRIINVERRRVSGKTYRKSRSLDNIDQENDVKVKEEWNYKIQNWMEDKEDSDWSVRWRYPDVCTPRRQPPNESKLARLSKNGYNRNGYGRSGYYDHLEFKMNRHNNNNNNNNSVHRSPGKNRDFIRRGHGNADLYSDVIEVPIPTPDYSNPISPSSTISTVVNLKITGKLLDLPSGLY